MFKMADKFQDLSSNSRDDERRDKFLGSEPHTAGSFEQTNSPMRIGKTVVIKGELTSSEDMVIFGRVEGTITVNDHIVTLGQGATVEAQITAHRVVVEGHVKGNVEAREHLEIGPGGMVIGDVNTPSLVIREGGALKGRVDMNTDRQNAAAKPKMKEEPTPAEDESSPRKREGGKVAPTRSDLAAASHP